MNQFNDEARAQICVVIPTLNEAATIGAVVESARAFCAEVLVIDGASNDGTIEAAREAGRARGSFRASRQRSRAATRAANWSKEPITVFIDADGSHDASDIPSLVAPLLDKRADMVVGSRWAGGSDELHGDMNKWLRRNGSLLLTTLVNLRFGADLSDIQNGFRAVDTRIAREIGLREIGFTIEQEMVMKFLAGCFRVINVPSHEYARQGGRAKLDLGQVWFHFGIVVLCHLFNLSRPRIRLSHPRWRKRK